MSSQTVKGQPRKIPETYNPQPATVPHVGHRRTEIVIQNLPVFPPAASPRRICFNSRFAGCIDFLFSTLMKSFPQLLPPLARKARQCQRTFKKSFTTSAAAASFLVADAACNTGRHGKRRPAGHDQALGDDLRCHLEWLTHRVQMAFRKVKQRDGKANMHAQANSKGMGGI